MTFRYPKQYLIKINEEEFLTEKKEEQERIELFYKIYQEVLAEENNV